jgi:hypothetical protein
VRVFDFKWDYGAFNLVLDARESRSSDYYQSQKTYLDRDIIAACGVTCAGQSPQRAAFAWETVK